MTNGMWLHFFIGGWQQVLLFQNNRKERYKSDFPLLENP